MALLDTQTASLLISLSALAISAFGILERRSAATRSDRLRLSPITDELNKVRLEISRLTSVGENMGDLITTLNGRAELLGQQGLALVQAHALNVTSAECRVVALALDDSGFREDSQEM
jgi:hypothetical protein